MGGVNKSFTRRTTVDTQPAATPTWTADNWSYFLGIVRDRQRGVAVGTACSLVDNKTSFHLQELNIIFGLRKKTSELGLIGELLSVVRQEHLKLPGVFL